MGNLSVSEVEAASEVAAADARDRDSADGVFRERGMSGLSESASASVVERRGLSGEMSDASLRSSSATRVSQVSFAVVSADEMQNESQLPIALLSDSRRKRQTQWDQFKILFHRQLKVVLRNPIATFLRGGLFCFIFIGLISPKTKSTIKGLAKAI